MLEIVRIPAASSAKSSPFADCRRFSPWNPAFYNHLYVLRQSNTAFHGAQSTLCLYRIATAFFTTEDSSERAAIAGNTKMHLASQSATKEKFKLLDNNTKEDVNNSGTEFAIVVLSVVHEFLGLILCRGCGKKGVMLSRTPDKEF